MFAKLKAVLSRLGGSAEEPAAEPVDYKGYRIRPAPYPNNGQFQTAGVIEKDDPAGIKAHRFVRADTHPTREAAIAFAISKAKQIIDLQGDRIFASGE